VNVLAVSALVVVLPVVSVLVADTIEDVRFRGRFDCGCKWPAEEDDDCPGVVTCPHGTWKFRVWRDWRGRQRDAWDETEPSEGETDEH